MRWVFLVIALAGTQTCALGQYLQYPAAGTPRTRDGKPILTAPAPREPGGKPDLSGIWQAEASPFPELLPLLPGGTNGLGEDIPSKYFLSIFADFKPGEEPLRERPRAPLTLNSFKKDDPGINCLPTGMPMLLTIPVPFKIVQTPGLILMLTEGDNSFRQVYTDGRKHPVDPQPAWLGYGVGKWDGDTMVVETTGFNDRGWLDARGHKHSEELRLIERYHRRDFGHMDVQLTLDDPKTFTRPFAIKFTERLLPDTDLLEAFCSENEKDRAHALLP